VCEDRWAIILRGSPIITTLHEFPRATMRSSRTPLSERWLILRRLVRRLRERDYDLTIDAQGLAKSAIITAAAGAPRRICHGSPWAREGSWLFAKRRSPTCAEHVIDQQRSLALPLLGSHHPRGPWSFPLPAWELERAWATTWLTRQGFATTGNERPWVLNVGAGWPTKVWPLTRQIELVRLLARTRIPLLLVWGSHTEHDFAEEIAAEAGYGVLCPPTTIPQLAGLLARARMVISGDTGPLHLSLALGTPAVGLFGPVPALRNGPRGRGYRTLQAPAAPWERRDMTRVDMSAISAEAVVEQAHAAIREQIPTFP
jgi:heptosyltransferase-1